MKKLLMLAAARGWRGFLAIGFQASNNVSRPEGGTPRSCYANLRV